MTGHMTEPENIHLGHQLDLLRAIEQRPAMYIRQDNIGNIYGLRDIENIMIGYEMRGDPQAEAQFSTEFIHYLQQRFSGVIAIAGFVDMVDEIALFHGTFHGPTSWSIFWNLVQEFKSDLEMKRGK